jgi:hypothetical protein
MPLSLVCASGAQKLTYIPALSTSQVSPSFFRRFLLLPAIVSSVRRSNTPAFFWGTVAVLSYIIKSFFLTKKDFTKLKQIFTKSKFIFRATA